MKNKKDEYADLINGAYDEYSKVPIENQDDYGSSIRKLMELIFGLYLKYLEEKTKDFSSYMGELYLDTFGKDNFLFNIIRNYDPKRGTFFNYLNSIVSKRVKSIRAKEEIENRRQGITNILTVKEEKILSLLLSDEYEEKEISSWGEKEYQEFCISASLPKESWEEVREIYRRNQDVNVRNQYEYNNENEEIDIIEYDPSNVKKGSRVESELFEEEKKGNELLHKLIKSMDAEIYPYLSEKQKLMWPDLYTGELTSKHIDDAWSRIKKKKSGEIRRHSMLTEHWSSLDIVGLREEYGHGKYLFIADAIFKYIIEKRKEVTLDYLAEKYTSCAKSYLCREKKKMMERIKKKYNNIFEAC